MKTKFTTFAITLAAIMGAASMFCSCTAQTAAFAENSSRVQDIAYPPDHIVGTWADVSSSQTQNPARDETKRYYDIKPNGSGHLRQFSHYRSSGHFVSMEADFKWSYLGNNRWRISLPASSAYKIIENHGVNIGHKEATDVTVRYYNDKLYGTGEVKIFRVGFVWVRATKEAITEHANSMRTQPNILKLGRQ